MSKIIRVSDDTFEKLAKLGKWKDTMDLIITRLIEQGAVTVMKYRR